MAAIARVEYDERPNIVQRWVAVMTSPSGMTRRKRHISRNAAIQTGASYLTIYDERVTQARLIYDTVRREVAAEHERQIFAETAPKETK